jgi:UDP:flavonoid glycosyltransferase YjiC (YdhE family)
MKQKILILTHPFSGHINPMTGFVYEMATKRNFKVIWYGISGVKDIIEKTGSEYRAYSYYPIENFNRKPSNEKQDSQFVQVAWEMLNLSDIIMHDLIKVVDDEKPDLIIYDTWALFSKFLMQILENRYKKKITKLPPPPAVMFSPFFGFKKGVYPNNEEFRMIIDYDFNYYYKSVFLFFKQLYFNYKYGLSYKEDAISLLFSHSGEINIISTSYDLQPKVDLFNENDYFVGW